MLNRPTVDPKAERELFFLLQYLQGRASPPLSLERIP